MSFSACTRRCKCFDGCFHVNYQRRNFRCELIQSTSPSYVYENADYVSISVISRSMMVCPHIATKKGANVLGNMNLVGSKVRIDCERAHEINGSQTASCTAEGLWTEHGMCVQLSTMRASCIIHKDCIDGGSECRDGQCWCKPGISHDSCSSVSTWLVRRNIPHSQELQYWF